MPADQHTALIVVDMQNAFIAPSSGEPVEAANAVVRAVNKWVAHAVDRRWPIFYTQDVAPYDLPDGDPDRQVDLHARLDVRGVVVPKGPGQYRGFSGFVLLTGGRLDGDHAGVGGLSSLAAHLREAHVETVIVVGIAADVCVSATARDARRLGYQVTVPLSATAFVHAHPDGDQAAIADLRAAGITVTRDGHNPQARPHR